MSAFAKVYPDQKPLLKAFRCNICHVGRNKRNLQPYGKRLKVALGEKNVKDEDRIRKALLKVGRPRVLADRLLVLSRHLSQQPLQRPRLFRQSRRNRRRRLESHVDATEIIPRREQCEHRFMILPLLGERIRQPRESPVLHPNRQIVPFNV